MQRSSIPRDCAFTGKKKTYHVSLTYFITKWRRVLLEKLTGSASSQKNSPHFWNPKVHHRTHKCPPPVPILSQLHPVPTTSSHFLEIHLNIILPSAAGSPHWSLSHRFPHQNPVHPSLLPLSPPPYTSPYALKISSR